MEKYNVIAIDIISKEENTLIIEEHEGKVYDEIILSVMLNGKKISSKNDCYFEAFKELRDKLLELNYGIKCKGALLNVVQSAMGSSTEKIYIVELGKQALMKNLVSIYDYIDIDEFVNSKEQRDFEIRWHESLKSN